MTANTPYQHTGNTQVTAPRIAYIDTAKGICILLVVLLHTGLPSVIIDFLGLLLMPLFFTLSGIFYKDYTPPHTALIKKINKILVPFLFFYIIGYIQYVAVQTAAHNEIEVPITYIAYAKSHIPNGVLWFLLALFWVNVFFMALRYISKNNLFLCCVTLASAVISLLLFSGETKLFLFIDSALIALPFFFMGHYLRNSGLLQSPTVDRYAWPTAIALLAVAIICFIIGDEPFIAIYSVEITGNPIMFGLGSIVLVLATILFCKKVGAIPFVTYMGRYSLIVLGVHLLVQQIVRTGLEALGMDHTKTLDNIIFYFIIVGVCALLIQPLIRLFPKFTGQKDLIRM